MSTLEILEFPDSRLRTRATPVESFDDALRELIGQMFDTMYAAQGIGLAATQVDVHKRLLVLDVSETRDQPHVYINPEILESEGTETCEEGCLSVPGVYAEIERAGRVQVRAQDGHGEMFERWVDGMHAICLQHEMDHLAGKLFVDYLSPLKQRMVRKKLEKQRRVAAREAVVL